MTFTLRDKSIPTSGSGRVLITDINPSGENNVYALICRSELNTSLGYSNWFLDPWSTSLTSTDDEKRILSNTDSRGWSRNRAVDSGNHNIARLRRVSDTAEEGRFTCHISGDIDSPRGLLILYPSEH